MSRNPSTIVVLLLSIAFSCVIPLPINENDAKEVNDKRNAAHYPVNRDAAADTAYNGDYQLYPQYPNGYPPYSGSYPQNPNGYPPYSGGYPQYPNVDPQYPGGYPQYPNVDPQYPGGYPQYPGGYPQYPGGYPQYPGGYPQYPGGYPQYPGGYPQYPVGYPQNPGGYPASYGNGFYYDYSNPGKPCGIYNIDANPCTNNVGAYYPVDNNPRYFVHCGAGGIPACKFCNNPSVWSQNNLVCV
ncbi:hypothetical protein CHUAL_000794 [Chamberlinius hualienensis]